MSSNTNRMSRNLQRLSRLPRAVSMWLLNQAVAREVPFAGRASVRIVELAEGRAVLELRNRRKVQNHIGGVHGAAMALLAETATGIVLSLSTPDTHVQLLKSMRVDYLRRAQGALRAEALLSPELRSRVRAEDKGDAAIPVRVTDEAGQEPIRCEFVWAWTPRRRPA